MNFLPGNTILPKEEIQPVVLSSFGQAKKIIILASNEINDESLFINGLTQNIIILYDLFESMGYSCRLLQTTVSTNKKTFLDRYQYIKTNELVTSSQPFHIFVEIGMSIDESTRRHLHSSGTRIAKLYLGNILYALERCALSLDAEDKPLDAAFYRGIGRKLAQAPGRSKRLTP